MNNFEVCEKEINEIYSVLTKTEEPILYCFEKIFEPQLFDKIEKSNLIKIIEIWTCCLIKFQKFSELIIHIESKHFENNYKFFTNKNSFIKTNCGICGNSFFTNNQAIHHFLKNHINHNLTCLSCHIEIFNLNDLIKHLTFCNKKRKN